MAKPRLHRPEIAPPMLEALEARWLPATIPALTLPGGPIMATFTDADNDTVTVRISGTSGQAVFQDAGGNPVDDGDDIATVLITGASPDFTLSYTFNASGGGANAVTMGDILASTQIRGVFTVGRVDLVESFVLGSFVGPGFTGGGGLSADNVTGNVAGIGIQLNNLPAGRTINIRNAFDADLVVGGVLGGTVNVGGTVAATSSWRVNGAVTPTAQIGVGGNFNGDVDVRGTFAGDVNISGDATGTWIFRNTVQRTATLQAELWSDLRPMRHWGGQLFAVSSDVAMTVSGHILGTSVFSVEGRLNLTVAGSILPGAKFGATSEIIAMVGGNLSGVWAGSQNVSLTVAGSVSRAVIGSGSDISMTVGRGVLNSRVNSDSDLILDVTGSVFRSALTAASALQVDVTGNIRQSILEGTSADAAVTVGGSLIGSRVTCGSNDLTVTVTGNMVNSSATTLEFDVTLTVGGSLTRSQITAASDVRASITRGVASTAVVATSGDVTLEVGGSVSRTRIEAGSDVTLSVGASLISSSVTGDEGVRVTVAVGLDVVGSHINGLDSDVTLSVGRNLVDSAVTSTSNVMVAVGGSVGQSQINSGDDVTLSVTGNVFRASIAAPETAATVSVGGNFLASSLICDEDLTLSVGGTFSGLVNSFDSDVTLTVGGGMRGQAIAGGLLLADLGALDGSLVAEDLDLIIQQGVSRRSRIQASEVDDFNGDTIGFRVGGPFAGVLNVLDFDSDEVGTSTLVLGAVLATARFNIVRTFGDTIDENFAFAGNFLGVLSVGGNLDVNLAFAGNVNQVTIGGTVGVAGAVNTISVVGRLTILTSNSLFDETVAGLDGNFVDGAGVVTGMLDTTGGFIVVVPTV